MTILVTGATGLIGARLVPRLLSEGLQCRVLVRVGSPVDPSAEPTANPWLGHLDGTLARKLGFKPVVRTVLQAAQQDWL